MKLSNLGLLVAILGGVMAYFNVLSDLAAGMLIIGVLLFIFTRKRKWNVQV